MCICTTISYPFICQWTSRLLSCPDYCKQCCDEHWGTHVSFNSGFLCVYACSKEDFGKLYFASSETVTQVFYNGDYIVAGCVLHSQPSVHEHAFPWSGVF